jgi:hypothetical protein
VNTTQPFFVDLVISSPSPTAYVKIWFMTLIVHFSIRCEHKRIAGEGTKLPCRTRFDLLSPGSQKKISSSARWHISNDEVLRL